MKGVAIFASGMAAGAAISFGTLMWRFVSDCWARPDA